MELSEFNYELPEELIAQTPIEKRGRKGSEGKYKITKSRAKH